ncbi:ROK family protein [Chitinophaga sp. 22321]|uniref:ROK family protein n=1 Tax=Chitinophaga hostae TaxID=2831022 RepID=A0ABS5IY32_9BACT|nr:ROK family protein [Chitinophaga hostae]MBS0027696.1 ROK family protein [Chitinophaga hostae]
MSQDFIISFDAGGTRLKAVVMAADEERVLKTFYTSSNAHHGADALMKAIEESVAGTQSEMGDGLLGIGLSLSGVIDTDKGVVYLPGKFKMLEGFPLVEKLKEKFQLPVIADNDGRLAVYAEKHIGLAKDKNWVVGLTIGTGIGSGVIIDGRMLTNRSLLFGTQVGHLILNSASNQLCLTGNYGTGETLCSATALVLQVRGAIQRGLPCILSDEYFADPLLVDFEKITYACRQGDTVCFREMEKWSDNLANLIVNAVHAYSPELIILGGGATLAADLFLDKVREKVNRQVFRYPIGEPVPIEVSQMQEYASALGAALFLKYSLKEK